MEQTEKKEDKRGKKKEIFRTKITLLKERQTERKKGVGRKKKQESSISQTESLRLLFVNRQTEEKKKNILSVMQQTENNMFHFCSSDLPGSPSSRHRG